MKLSVLARCAFSLVVLGALCALPAAAQFDLGGDLPQEAKKGIEAAMLRLESQGAMTTRAGLAETVGQEKVDRFVENAVVKLVLAPDGSYEVMTKPGGDLVSFNLGKQKVQTQGDASEHQQWMVKEGAFDVPKRQAKVKLNMKAGAREVTVDCFNRYRKSKEPVTFYVGPLNGLFCMGMTDGEQAGSS